MSDIIWHYCCLMGGVSASSARGIRTSTAGAVCLDLNSQLLLPQHSPPTPPDNLDSGVRGRTVEWNSCAEFWKEEDGALAVLAVVAVKIRSGVPKRFPLKLKGGSQTKDKYLLYCMVKSIV